MKTKATSKIMMAALALVMALALATGTTFAWFSMNNTVSVTGMSVTTKVNNNLLIAADTTASTTNAAENTFQTSFVAEMPTALLEPVSTIDGETFYYTSSTNVGGSGAVKSADYIEYDPSVDTDSDGTNDFNENAGTTDAVGYVDYAFQLKANNTGAATAHINVTALNFTYADNSTAAKAFRIAIFAENLGTNPNVPAGGVGVLKTILKPADAHYFSYDAEDANPVEEAVSDTDAKDEVSELGTAAEIGTVAGNTTHYYKVVVRLWLEGEDTTCNNDTFAQLTDKWALDLTIALENTEGDVSSFTPAATAEKIDLSDDVGIDNSVDPKTIDGETYYPLDYDEGEYYTNAISFGSTSRVFTITNNHPIEVTYKCILPAPVGP